MDVASQPNSVLGGRASDKPFLSEFQCHPWNCACGFTTSTK